jgi:hypothetical protein
MLNLFQHPTRRVSDLLSMWFSIEVLKQVTHDIIKKTVILSDSQEFSAKYMVAIQGEEDPSYLSI